MQFKHYNQLKEIPTKLKGLREKDKLSQKEVAEHLAVSQSTYNYMESGKTHPDAKHLILLSQLYNINVTEFFGEGNLFFIQENNQHAQMASTMNVKENNDKEKILKIYETRIVELEEKIKRKDLKIEELKKNIEKRK